MRALLVVVAACASSTAKPDTLAILRNVRNEPWGSGQAKIEAAAKALAELKVDDAKTELDAAEKAGPLDHDHHVMLWEQRGIAAAYVDDEAGAKTAFDMMLALDPSHILSYTLSPKATFVFEAVRKARTEVPAIDVTWPHGGKVDDPLPLDVEVLSDPKKFLRRATVFVRERGQAAWLETRLALDQHERRIVLPPLAERKPVSLELYVRAYDDHDNEVLVWADPTKPREIPLRYDPPQPWYRKWWVIAIAGTVAVVGSSVTVYELTIAPPDKIMGGATVK